MSIKRTCFIPTVLLRCHRCRNETPHALIDFKKQTPWLTLIYECQACGEVRKLLDIELMPEPQPEHMEKVAEEEKKERPIPIERGPQIEQSSY